MGGEKGAEVGSERLKLTGREKERKDPGKGETGIKKRPKRKGIKSQRGWINSKQF